ncbi:Protein of unknown function [Cotesia congregata]|uniref:Uncharacterized protein n=1 Tax=Cotesia congregata TaxID=51543 RepID=A0A8J2ME06_COTCN|nr:Protein of unknown function [Cotesia congregata]
MTFKLFGCCIFVSLFFAYIVCVEDIKISSKQTDQRISLVNELMEQCFNIQASILITDSPSNSLVNELYESIPQSVLFLNKSANYNIPTNQNTPVPSIIMILSSPAAMEQVLVNEAWRNFNQYFIILDENNGNGCVSAQSFLMEAWKNDILNVVFICLDHQNQIPTIYSFNPFTSSAPMSWMKISVVSAINNHSWTLFSQNYIAGDTLCSDLFYKKTGNLGGYEFDVLVDYKEPYIWYTINNGVINFEGFDYEIMKLLVSKLNMILQVFFVTRNESSCYFRIIFFEGGYSLGVNSIRMNVPNTLGEMTHPFYQAGFSVITRSRELKGLQEYLFDFLPLSIVLSFFIISVVIFILLRYLLRDPYSRNFIDIILFFLNLSLPRLPVTIRGRVLFGATFLSFTFANIFIQANMSTVLSSFNMARNVEKIEDLKELNYNILSDRLNEAFLTDLGSKNIDKIFNISSCSQLQENEAFAEIEMLLHPLVTENCYMPKKPLIPEKHYCYITQRNWPIFPEMNEKLLMLIEGGLNDYYIKKISTFETSRARAISSNNNGSHEVLFLWVYYPQLKFDYCFLCRVIRRAAIALN